MRFTIVGTWPRGTLRRKLWESNSGRPSSRDSRFRIGKRFALVPLAFEPLQQFDGSDLKHAVHVPAGRNVMDGILDPLQEIGIEFKCDSSFSFRFV